MPEYFFDTSAFVKHYVDEDGSRTVSRLLAPADGYDNGLYVAAVTLAEAVAAIHGRGRRPGGAAGETHRIGARLRRDFPLLAVAVRVSQPVIERAADMAAKHVLRGYDAVQLAVAQTVDARSRAMGMGPVTVVSSDRQLNVAAEAEGLEVLDPTDM